MTLSVCNLGVCIIIEPNSQKTFLGIVQFTNMADMTSGASQRFPDSNDVEVGKRPREHFLMLIEIRVRLIT